MDVYEKPTGRSVWLLGLVALRELLELGQDVDVVVHGAVVKEETLDNQDGSVNIVYVVKPMTVEIK